MPEAAEQLLDLLDALDEASQFCTSGMLAPVLPGLEVEGVGDVVELPGPPVVAGDPTAGHLERLRPEFGRDPPPLVPVAVAATFFAALVTTAAQCFRQLLFEDHLNRFQHASAEQLSNVLAQADDVCPLRGTFAHGVTLHRLLGDFALQLGRLRHLYFSTGPGTHP